MSWESEFSGGARSPGSAHGHAPATRWPPACCRRGCGLGHARPETPGGGFLPVRIRALGKGSPRTGRCRGARPVQDGVGGSPRTGRCRGAHPVQDGVRGLTLYHDSVGGLAPCRTVSGGAGVVAVPWAHPPGPDVGPRFRGHCLPHAFVALLSPRPESGNSLSVHEPMNR